MTIPTERSRAFIAGLELLQDLLNPGKTPGVPEYIRDRARYALRHFPTASEVLLMAENHKPGVLSPELFDAGELDRYLVARRPVPVPLPLRTSDSEG